MVEHKQHNAPGTSRLFREFLFFQNSIYYNTIYYKSEFMKIIDI